MFSGEVKTEKNSIENVQAHFSDSKQCFKMCFLEYKEVSNYVLRMFMQADDIFHQGSTC